MEFRALIVQDGDAVIQMPQESGTPGDLAWAWAQEEADRAEAPTTLVVQQRNGGMGWVAVSTDQFWPES